MFIAPNDMVQREKLPSNCLTHGISYEGIERLSLSGGGNRRALIHFRRQAQGKLSLRLARMSFLVFFHPFQTFSIPRLSSPFSFPSQKPVLRSSKMKRMAMRACARLVCCVVLGGMLLPCDVSAAPERSRAQVRAFLRQQGLERTPPGYEVDHIVPLCAGGADRPENMQLLTKRQHREKTREDLRLCRKLKRGKK